MGISPPHVQLAHKAVHKAIQKGLLVPQPCERCGAVKKVHAHHDDYTKHLDVMWLCSTHHKGRHRELVIESGASITRNATGYRGVSSRHGTFRAHFAINGRSVNLGKFPTAEQAARAFDKAAFEHHGASAFLNFPITEAA